MKARPPAARRPALALGLWLALAPPCGGHRRLAVGAEASRREAGEASISEALRWLERTKASVAKLERSFSRARHRFSSAERLGLGGLAGKEPTAGAFLQRGAGGAGLEKAAEEAAQAGKPKKRTRVRKRKAGQPRKRRGGKRKAGAGRKRKGGKRTRRKRKAPQAAAAAPKAAAAAPKAAEPKAAAAAPKAAEPKAAAAAPKAAEPKAAAAAPKAPEQDLKMQALGSDGAVQAQGDLNITDLALGALERSVAAARSELSRAETESVNATLDAAPAHRDLMRVRRATHMNARVLRNLSQEAAQMNLSMAKDTGTLNSSLALAEDLFNATQFMESEAARQMEAGQAFERLEHEIKEAGDEGPNSVQAARERVQTIEAELEEFEGSLREKVRTFLVRRLRRGTREVRTALRRMSNSMPPLVDFREAAGAPTAPPLGLDLGLAGAS